MGRSLTVYQKPTCSTCRQLVRLLEERGLSFTAIDYYETPFTRKKLKTLLKKAGLGPRDILRTKEEVYKQLRLGEKELTSDELIDLMIEHPDLIQRPLVEAGDQALLARPPETIEQLLERR